MPNPWDNDPIVSGGPVYGPPPKPPAPRDPLQVQIDEERLNNLRHPKPNLPVGFEMNPDGSAQRIRGLPVADTASGPKISAKVREDAIQAHTDAAALEALADKLEGQFKAGPGATSGIAGLQDYLPTPSNRVMNDTSSQARGLVKRALGFTGGEGNTIGEIQLNYGPYLPEASNYDPQIENKIQALRTLAANSRKRAIAVLGGEPDVNGAVAPVDAQQAAPVVHDANLGGEQIALSQNGTQTVDNPQLAGVRGEYLSRLERGDGPGQIVQFLRQAGVSDPRLLQSAIKQANFRKQHPEVPIAKYNTSELDQMDVPLSSTEGAMNDLGQSALGAYAMRAGNAASFNTLDNIVGATGGNAERARIGIEDASNNHPMAGLAGDLSGGVMAALGGEAALARGGMGAGFGRAALADTGYGAAAGAGAADDGNRLQGAGYGTLAGLVGSVAGQGVTGGAGRMMRGVSDPSVSAVSSYAPLTLGQSVGRSGRLGEMVKGVEDRLSGLPVVGDVVNARRREGVRAMNAKAFDKALEPIGETVGNKVGEEAVAEARGMVSNAFQKALAGKVGRVDTQFAQQARAPMERLASIKRDGLGEEIVGQIEEATTDLFDDAGNISGENMQALLESLRQIRSAYRGDPLAKKIGDSVKQVERAVEGIFERQAPEVMPQYRAAKQAYRRLSTIGDAVNAGKNSEGMFTPAQLGTADRANSKKYDGALEAASGGAPFHQFQRDAQNVLPNRIPDSGTVGRFAVPAGLVAAGTGTGAAMGDTQTGAQTGIGLATLLSLLYSRLGSRFLSGMATRRGPKAKAVGNALKKNQRLIGHAAASGAISSGD